MKTLILASALMLGGAAVAQTTHSSHASGAQQPATTQPSGTATGTMSQDTAQGTGAMTQPMSQPSTGTGTMGDTKGTMNDPGTGMMNDTGTGTMSGTGNTGMTGVGGPGEARNYPPCSRTVTDSCIQTYERGVRRPRR